MSRFEVTTISVDAFMMPAITKTGIAEIIAIAAIALDVYPLSSLERRIASNVRIAAGANINQ